MDQNVQKTLIFSQEYGVDDIDSVVAQLLPHAKQATILLLKGNLGAGKTTLVKSLLAALGVGAVVNSPTFAYVNSYSADHGREIFHFDLYRLSTLESFLCQGFDEYVCTAGAISVVEWPGILDSWLKEQSFDGGVFELELDYCEDALEKRSITLRKCSRK